MSDLTLTGAVQGLMLITPRLAKVLIGTVFIVVHVVLAVICLFLLWWFQVSPDLAARGIHSVLNSPLFANTYGTLAFAGLTGTLLLVAYWKLWRFVLHRLLQRFLFSPVIE